VWAAKQLGKHKCIQLQVDWGLTYYLKVLFDFHIRAITENKHIFVIQPHQFDSFPVIDIEYCIKPQFDSNSIKKQIE
jgi:hypothetical protein